MNHPPRRPLGHALKEAGKAIGCVGLTVLGVLTPVTCVGIVTVNLAAAKSARAELDLRALEQALQRYHERTGELPRPVDGLNALVDEGLLREPPRDPWGNPYTYTVKDGVAELGTLGADGAPGGEDENRDTVLRIRPPLDSRT